MLFSHTLFARLLSSDELCIVVDMAPSPLSGAPACSSVQELRKTAKNAPKEALSSLSTASSNALAAIRRTDCLHVYHVCGSADDALLVAVVYEQLRVRSSNSRGTGEGKPCVVVCVSESHARAGSFDNILHTIQLHSDDEGKSTNNGCVLFYRMPNDCVFILCKGVKDFPQTTQIPQSHWTSLQHAAQHLVTAIKSAWEISNQTKLILFNTTSPVLIACMPPWFWPSCHATLFVSTLCGPTFTLSPPTTQYRTYWDRILQLSTHTPIIHTSPTYSTSGRLDSLTSLPAYSQTWPLLLPPPLTRALLHNTLDALTTYLLRFAGALSAHHGADCVARARALFAHDPAAAEWMRRCLEPAYYDKETLTVATVLNSRKVMAEYMACPIDADAAALLCLLPGASRAVGASDLVAARVVVAERSGAAAAAGAGATPVDVYLSGEGNQYVLLDRGVSGAVDECLKRVFEGFVGAVKARGGAAWGGAAPTMPRPMAVVWRDYVRATKGTVEFLAREEERRGGKGKLGEMRRESREGAMTVIAKRSL